MNTRSRPQVYGRNRKEKGYDVTSPTANKRHAVRDATYLCSPSFRVPIALVDSASPMIQRDSYTKDRTQTNSVFHSRARTRLDFVVVPLLPITSMYGTFTLQKYLVYSLADR